MEAEAEDRRRIAQLREIALLVEQRLQVDGDATLGEHAQAIQALKETSGIWPVAALRSSSWAPSS